jgi:threonine/homoserine/homoserine lactone efflux protein
VLGWILGIVAAMSVLVVVASSQSLSTGGEPSDTSSWIKLILGLLLIAFAVKGWRARPASGTDPTMPGGMKRVDAMGPWAALGLGLLVSALNPKGLLLMAGGAVAIGEADLSSSDEAICVAVFTVIGASTIAFPALAYLILGERIRPTLDGAKGWLTANNTGVMAVLFLVIGAGLFGKGLGGLT